MNDVILLPPPKPPAKPQAEAQARPQIEIDVQPPEDIRLPPPGRSMAWKALAAPAAALVLVFGIGWTVAARINDARRGPDPDQMAAQAAARSAAEVLRATQAQQREIADLRGHVESLKNKLEAQAQKSHAAESTLATLQKSLAEQKAAEAAATSQLQAKLEKVRSLSTERAADRSPVASIARALPKPELKPSPKAVAAQVSTAAYRAYVLRDVEDGRAVVEGSEGLVEVGPGDVLPGGARVEKIVRRGRDWTVLTDRGAINPDGRWDD